ncbi:MAG: TetR/AcrR family transcriptional regulator [Oscillospiraceae bacterium]
MSKIKQKQMKRRSEIIEAVIPLLNSVSFDELSVNDICEAAGISVGSFYHYFSKKADLLVGLLGIIDDYMEAVAFPQLTRDSEIENLKLFSHYWATHVEEHGIERSKLVSSVLPANTDHTGQKRRAVAKLEEIILRGQQKGEITRDYDAGTLTEYFLLALRGVTTDWSRHDGSYPLKEQMDAYISFWLKAIV